MEGINKMKKTFLLVALVSVTLGCSTLRHLATVLPGGVTFSDLEVTGVKAGEVMPVIASINGDQNVPSGFTQSLGVLMPILVPGDTTPKLIYCSAGENESRCKGILINGSVTVAGYVVGNYIIPKRISKN